MSQEYVIKNGLIYTPDLKTVLGVDVESGEFTGRIPFGVHFIDNEVFSECPYENISLPDSIEKLGDNLFSDSKNLKSIKLPTYIDELPAYMLSGCTSLVKVTMPTQVLGFSEGLFNGCTSLEEIPFRAGVDEIPENFCSGCTSVKSLVFPIGVTKIDSCAAAFCTNLKAIVIPATLEYLADDAFKGCPAIQNIRVDGNNSKFFVKDDGCLYEKTENGEKLKVAVAGALQQDVAFFKENVDEETDDFFSNEDVNEIDDTFSSEVAATAEEENALEVQPQESKVDDVLNDIMNEERARNESVADVSVGEQESQMLSQMMDVMDDNTTNSVAVTEDELARLAMGPSQVEEEASPEPVIADKDKIDSKTSILISAAQFSKIIDCKPEDKPTAEGELFVIAENTVKNELGQECFTPKLELCCKTFAHIQNFRRVVLLKGLPIDNEEFKQFYYHFMGSKHVILACNAKGPSSLSEYAKAICEQSRISLDRNELAEQRKRISIKNDMLIKLVIQDVYNS